jgi:hypothetical protein
MKERMTGREIMSPAGRKYYLSEKGEIPGSKKVLGQVKFHIGKRNASPSPRPLNVRFLFPTTKEELAMLDNEGLDTMLPNDPLIGGITVTAQQNVKQYTHPGDAKRKLDKHGFIHLVIDVATEMVPDLYSVQTDRSGKDFIVAIVERGSNPLNIHNRNPRHVTLLEKHSDLIEQPQSSE